MFDHFNIVAPVYDRVIRVYDHSRMCRLLDLPARVRLLDVGGGTGRVSQRLHPLADQVVICDMSRAMLCQAARRKKLNPVRARAESLPFADGTFDRILVVDALHHFYDQKQALADMVRVLKPGGRLVIEEPDKTRPVVKIVVLLEKLALMRSHFLTSRQIVELLNGLGLATRVEDDGRFIYWVQGNKPQ